MSLLISPDDGSEPSLPTAVVLTVVFSLGIVVSTIFTIESWHDGLLLPIICGAMAVFFFALLIIEVRSYRERAAHWRVYRGRR